MIGLSPSQLLSISLYSPNSLSLLVSRVDEKRKNTKKEEKMKKRRGLPGVGEEREKKKENR
jgi:hypothetical protein